MRSTDRNQEIAIEKMKSALETWDRFLEASPDAMWIKDKHGKYVAANKMFYFVEPSMDGKIIGKTDAECYPPDKAALFMEDDRYAIEHGSSEREFMTTNAAGEQRTYLTKKVILKNADGSVYGTLGVSRDVTERKQLEQALAASHATLLEAQSIAHIGDWSMDVATHMFVWSDEIYVIHGIEKGTPMSMSAYAELIHPDDRKMVFEAIRLAMINRKQEFVVDYRIVCPKGCERFISLTGKTIVDCTGTVTGFRGTMQDITERKQLEQELKQLATHDSLTGLPNRVLLPECFATIASLAKRDHVKAAVMSMDLDKFKDINDTFGHDIGDLALKTVSLRTNALVRGSDTLFRVGGDEFMFIALGTEHIESIAVMAQRILDSFTEPLVVENEKLFLSTSIGIAVYPDDGEDLATLTKKSDIALYCSKDRGKHQFMFYDQITHCQRTKETV
jgi:diguanylate cyclase (GGDEF)-like protein/PAS domain S-box-containing protein